MMSNMVCDERSNPNDRADETIGAADTAQMK